MMRPEQSDYQSDAGAVDQVAVVGGEQPFADAGAAGVGLIIRHIHTTNWRAKTIS